MKNSLPVIVYVLGMASFFLLDIFVANKLSIVQISEWAETKSYLFVGSTILLLGMDQVFVRHIESSFEIVKRAGKNILIIGAFGFAVLTLVGLRPVYLIGAVCAMASTTMLYAIFRGLGFKLQAQLAVNGWKLAMFISVTLVWISGATLVFPLLATLSCITVSLAICVLNRKTLINITLLQEYSGHYESGYTKLGLKYLVTLLSLSLSIYLEQILLNANDYVLASAQFFAHIAVILPPIVFLNGYLGFIVGPFVRRSPERAITMYIKFRVIISAIAVVGAIGITLASQVIFQFVIGDNVEFSFSLAMCIAGIGLCRFIYTFPSGVVSVLGSGAEINKLVFFNVLGVFMLVAGFHLFLKFGVEPALAVGIASLSNWILRAVNAVLLIRPVVKRYA